MKQIWCDFDGVIVKNEMHNANTAKVTPAEFHLLATKAYEQNPAASYAIKKLIRQNRINGARVSIITGRKKSTLGFLTQKVLKDHKIEVDALFFYPEENSYTQKEYFSWKTTVISSSMKKTDNLETWVIDDDLQLLNHLKTHLPTGRLCLTHYELNPNGRDTMIHLQDTRCLRYD